MSHPFRTSFLSAMTATALFAMAAPAMAAPAGCQGQPSATWINVDIAGVRSGNGLVAVSVYGDDAGRFLAHHGSLFTARVSARQGITTACVFVPKPGVYAMAVYHDENASRKFDRTGLGLPAEGFGFTNNASTFLGLPRFAAVRLPILRTDLTTRIKLRYP